MDLQSDLQTYDNQLWNTASTLNIEILEMLQSKLLGTFSGFFQIILLHLQIKSVKPEITPETIP